jgi:hypothetical protein
MTKEIQNPNHQSNSNYQSTKQHPIQNFCHLDIEICLIICAWNFFGHLNLVINLSFDLCHFPETRIPLTRLIPVQQISVFRHPLIGR